MNITKIIDGLKELPTLCGWAGGVVTIESADEFNEIYVTSEIHHSKLE